MRVFCGGTRAGLEPKLGVSLLQKKREERHLRTVLGPALQKKENRRRSSGTVLAMRVFCWGRVGIGFRAKTWGFSSAKEKGRPSSADGSRSCSAKENRRDGSPCRAAKENRRGFRTEKGF